MEGGQEDDDFTPPERGFLWDIPHVADWEELIKDYREDKKKHCRDLLVKYKLTKERMVSTDGWDLLVDDKTLNIKIETKTTKEGNLLMRAQGPVDHPPMDVARLYSYGPLQKEFDLNEDWTKTLEKVGVNMYVVHKKTMGKFVMSSRDFVVNALFNTEADGSVYMVSSSDNVTTKVDEISGVVRGLQPHGGVVFQAVPGDPN